MTYEWDPDKAASNVIKHGVDFADAALVLEDLLALTRRDATIPDRRFVTVGASPDWTILVVVWTRRGRSVRIISARRATPRERRQYEADR